MSTSRRKRKLTRQQQSETTRQALLDVSLELFIRRGYAGTTVRDIAKKAGISVGLMFHYFSSKQALLEAHIETVERGLDSVAAILNSSETSIDTFRQIADLILGSFQEPYGRNLFLLANQVLSLDSIPNAVKRRVSATKSLQASVPVIMTTSSSTPASTVRTSPTSIVSLTRQRNGASTSVTARIPRSVPAKKNSLRRSTNSFNSTPSSTA